MDEGDRDGENRLLCEAAEAGDIPRLKSLIAKGADPNGCWDQDSAYRDAGQSAESAEELRARGDLHRNLTDEERGQMFESWSRQNQERAAQVASAPYEHEIPLFCAAWSGSAECLKTLLDAGADPFVRDNRRRTAMYVATSLPVIHLLASAGLPVEDSDLHGVSPLTNAVRGSGATAERLRAWIEYGVDLEQRDKQGHTLFLRALTGMDRSIEILRCLIESGASPNAAALDGNNAFHVCLEYNWGGEDYEHAEALNILPYLYELGIDIHGLNNRGETPFAYALSKGCFNEAFLLRDLGAT